MTAETGEQRVQRVLRNKAVLDRVRLMQARVLLEQAREKAGATSEPEPLVSVRICTFNRPDLLVERAIASVSRQTYKNWEIVVVGDGASPETEETLRRLNHPRVRYQNLPARPRYPRFPRFFWFTAGIYAVNAALDLCRGSWIAPLDDDDEFSPDHIEVLLKEARLKDLELVYGQMDIQTPEGWQPLGIEPLTKSKVCHGAVMYSARLQGLRYDPFTWLDQEPGDWNLWKRMIAIGARIGFVPRVVGRHHPEFTAIDPDERRRLFAKKPTVDELLSDIEWTGANQFLRME